MFRYALGVVALAAVTVGIVSLAGWDNPPPHVVATETATCGSDGTEHRTVIFHNGTTQPHTVEGGMGKRLINTTGKVVIQPGQQFVFEFDVPPNRPRPAGATTLGGHFDDVEAKAHVYPLESYSGDVYNNCPPPSK